MFNKKGKKNWLFCDGYLPPHGENPDFQGHEALMITNITKKDAKITLDFIFENKEPICGIPVELKSMRTIGIRLDLLEKDGKPLLTESEQYTVWVKSNVKVCACFGRLDVRQTNMAYYSVEGYAF